MTKEQWVIIGKAQDQRIDKFFLIENCKQYAPDAYTDDFYKVIDSIQFYQMFGNRLAREKPYRFNEVFGRSGMPEVWEYELTEQDKIFLENMRRLAEDLADPRKLTAYCEEMRKNKSIKHFLQKIYFKVWGIGKKLKK